MKVPKAARKLKYRLLGTGIKPHMPSFREHDLVSALRKYLELKSRSTSLRDGSTQTDFPASQNDVVTYFRQRSEPFFFADSSTLAALADGMASSNPGWRERTLAKVDTDRTEGLKIYSLSGPPLRQGFPWSGLQSEPNKDDLYSTRPHRFGFAPRHALAVLYGGGTAETLADILEDWMTFAERGRSELPYCSALVVIQRLLSLSWAHALVMALPNPDEATIRLHADILRILHADIDFLMPRLGNSTTNNHLLADQFASWYIRLLFPEFVSGPADLDGHEAAWISELDRQIYSDGTSFEHSLHYHEFACEMAAAYVLLCRRNSRPIPHATLQRIERMLAFQTGLAGPASVTIPFGDATEDPLFALDPAEAWNTAGLRELYRALFRPELRAASPAEASVERAFWLLGGALAPDRSYSADQEVKPQAWLDGGFGVFPDESGSTRLIFRTGPARHHKLFAGHMHADLLSVCFTLGDEAVLTDPGTWSYRWRSSDMAWGRSYFSGPAAHNGVSVDAIDPLGPVRGDFRKREIPVRVSTTRCLLGSRLSWMEAEIRGNPTYAGHRRGVVQVSGAYWIVYDLLPLDVGRHTATFGFQAASGVAATQEEPGMVRLRTRAGAMWITNGPGLDEARIAKGESAPPGGWVAPSYGELVAAPQLRYIVANGTAVTALALGTGTVARPVTTHSLRTGIVIEIEGSGTRDLLLLSTHHESIQVRVDGRTGKSAALWMRTRHEQLETVRCLDFQEMRCSQGNGAKRFQEYKSEATCRMESDRNEMARCAPKELSASLSGKAWRWTHDQARA